MFVAVEKYKTPAKILLGLIALTFVGFGVSTVAAPGSDYIVKVGGQKVSEHQLNTAMQNMQAAGGSESRDAVFNALVQRALLTEGAREMGISVSQEQLKQIIVDEPSFHDQNGKFSQNIFNQYLNQRQMSEDQLIEEIRNEFAVNNLISLVNNGNLVSDAQAKQLIMATQAERTVRSVSFSSEAFVQQVKTDDAVLKKYYDANKKDYVIPQAVKVEHVALNIQDVAKQQTVSEEELKKAFEQESASAKPSAKSPIFCLPCLKMHLKT